MKSTLFKICKSIEQDPKFTTVREGLKPLERGGFDDNNPYQHLGYLNRSVDLEFYGLLLCMSAINKHGLLVPFSHKKIPYDDTFNYIISGYCWLNAVNSKLISAYLTGATLESILNPYFNNSKVQSMISKEIPVEALEHKESLFDPNYINPIADLYLKSNFIKQKEIVGLLNNPQFVNFVIDLENRIFSSDPNNPPRELFQLGMSRRTDGSIEAIFQILKFRQQLRCINKLLYNKLFSNTLPSWNSRNIIQISSHSRNLTGAIVKFYAIPDAKNHEIMLGRGYGFIQYSPFHATEKELTEFIKIERFEESMSQESGNITTITARIIDNELAYLN